MATAFLTRQVAAALKADQKALRQEFVSNVIPNGHLVAAGVVAVNRAQEYGYTLSFVFRASRSAFSAVIAAAENF
jgi:hypothetical protein